MTKKERVTRRSVLASFLALAVCISMLVGTSYAWFTDSVTSSGNVIKSGKLDIEMYWADGKGPTDNTAQWQDASAGAIFKDDVLWEPGFVQVRHINIKNVGNLAFKYKFAIVANGTLDTNANGHTLADAIDVYYVDPAVQIGNRDLLTDAYKLDTLTNVLANIAGANSTAQGVLYPAGKEPAGGKSQETVTIALKMRENAGNEYQDMTLGTDFSVQVLATQYTFEEDTFDKEYDAGLTPTSGMVLQQKDNFVLGVRDDGETVLVQSTENLNGKALQIPEGVTIVGDYAFANVGLTSITTSSTVKEISSYAFMSDSATYASGAITNVTLNSGLEKIGYRAFKAQPITSLTIPNTVKEIKGAFYQCSSLTSVTFEPVSQITDFTQAFAYCTSLSSITLPENLVVFGQDALRETAITTLTIPASVTTIGSQSLRQCMQLTDIYLNCASTPTIANNTFTNCNHTITIHVANQTVLNELLTAYSMTEGVAKTVWGTSIILTSA